MSEQRLIDAKKIIRTYQDKICADFDCGICKVFTKDERCGFEMFIEEQPTVDAVPVVHGHWIECEDEYTSYLKCSVCGDEFCSWEGDCARTKYCPECGAKMDETD